MILQLQAGTQVKKHMVAKHTPVGRVPYSYSHTNVPSSLEQKTNFTQEKVLCKSVENITFDKRVESKAASDSELNSSIESIPTEVLYIHSDICERISPLDEFNTLHRHSEGVRRSIKVKESSIV